MVAAALALPHSPQPRHSAAAKKAALIAVVVLLLLIQRPKYTQPAPQRRWLRC